jgi:outer membrane protein OmpA-like peptidoglycan-associated protein
MFEDNYKLTMGFLGLSAAARLQFIPRSLYGTIGLEYAALLTNSFSGYEKIVRSSNGYTFPTLPGNQPTQFTEITVAAQKQTNYFNSSQLALKLGIGTFIGLGTSHWVITPELNVGIPLSSFFQSQIESNYKNGYLTNNPNNPNYATATPPKLWYASVSIALKFPFGAMSKADMESGEGTPSGVPPAGYADLTGKVTDAKTGKPVQARLTVTDLGDNEVVTTTPTDDDGAYKVRVKAPGKYSVTADADDHLFGSDYDEVDPEGRIVQGNHGIKLPEATGRTKLLVFFDPGKTELKRSSYPELDRVVRVMQADPNMEVEIAGYTDSEGDDSHNLELSRRRADAVKEYLLKKGIPENRIVTKGYGKENPIASNDTEDGRAENRRVEFVVLKR